MTELYQPDSELLSVGEPIGPNEVGDTLIRFPGSCGLADLASAQMKRLAPVDNRFLYLFKNRYGDVDDGIRAFGTLAVFRTARFGIVRIRDSEVLSGLLFNREEKASIYVGRNEAVEERDYFWMPPEMFFAQEDWTKIQDREGMIRIFGAGYDRRLDGLKAAVRAYIEEVRIVEASGNLPDRSWYRVPAQERAKILKGLKADGHWTPGTGA